MNHKKNENTVSRRSFIHKSSVGTLGLATGSMLSQVPLVHAAEGDREFRIGVIGCGGRGTGAVVNAVGAAAQVIYPEKGYHTENLADGAKAENKNVKVVALADMFEDRLEGCRKQMSRVGFDIPQELCFTGFDAYKQLLAVSDVNYVILATPPHFRPAHLQAAVEAGKHVFMEKPVAVDVPGVKTVIAAGELAKQKGLGIAAGTQRRHQKSYIETIKRVRDGAIGEITHAKCYWNGGQIWVVARRDGWSDMEWQLRNWNYFSWLSGDHYVEQHVHNLDVMNWVLGNHPIRAVSGIGGRQVRTGEEYGQVYDHFAVEFEYPGGITMHSQARQINGCQNIVGEEVFGAKGWSNCKNLIHPREGDEWVYRSKDVTPYQLEHEDLMASIRDGSPINEAQAIAEATMTGIIGREAAYSGRKIDWDEAMKSETRLGPTEYKLGDLEIAPVPMPGKYRFS